MKKLIQTLIVCGLFVVMGGTASAISQSDPKLDGFWIVNEKLSKEQNFDHKDINDPKFLEHIGSMVMYVDKNILIVIDGGEVIKDEIKYRATMNDDGWLSDKNIYEGDKVKKIQHLLSVPKYKGKELLRVMMKTYDGPELYFNREEKKKIGGELLQEIAKLEKEAVTSAKSTVNCSSETDSLKRLTCYDNLPENLKNIKCSSVSDSLKRLSCFESKKNGEFTEATNVGLPLKPSIIIPNDQKVFVKLVSSFIKKYNQSTNELQKSSTKRKRSNKLKEFFKGKVSISNWVGRVSRLGTTSSGNAELNIKLSGNQSISIGTTNNELSDALQTTTLIPIGSKLFDKVSGFSTGDKIRFSGNFIVSDEGSYIKEQSITESGSMRNPEFLFQFSETR